MLTPLLCRAVADTARARLHAWTSHRSPPQSRVATGWRKVLAGADAGGAGPAGVGGVFESRSRALGRLWSANRDAGRGGRA